MKIRNFFDKLKELIVFNFMMMMTCFCGMVEKPYFHRQKASPSWLQTGFCKNISQNFAKTDITSLIQKISRKNDKAVAIMIKTQILSWKTIEDHKRLKVRVRFKFLLFYLNSPPLTRDVICSRFYLEKIGANVRWTPWVCEHLSTRCWCIASG